MVVMSKFDEVTKKIIEQVEAGSPPWIKPFGGGASPMPKRINGECYQGINILLLWMEQQPQATWMTYRQANELGAQVRKGEKSTKVCYAAPVTNKDDETYQVYKWYSVFNAHQIDGLPDQYYAKHDEFKNPDAPDANADTFIENSGASIRFGNTKAFYMPSQDKIEMPSFNNFRSGLDYYSTMLHELTHWTGHVSRCDRNFSPKRKEYAIEELVAEMGAAFLMSHLGLTPSIRPDHASYISNWLQALSNDTKFIFSAASAASKAAQFVIDKQTSKLKEAA